MTEQELKTFFDGYCVCALWSSVDYETETPLDKDFDIYDIENSTLDDMKNDCKDFLRSNYEKITSNYNDLSYAGHDFWLSRNGHGAGFFDRDFVNEEDREILQEAARIYRSYNLGICNRKVAKL